MELVKHGFLTELEDNLAKIWSVGNNMPEESDKDELNNRIIKMMDMIDEVTDMVIIERDSYRSEEYEFKWEDEKVTDFELIKLYGEEAISFKHELQYKYDVIDSPYVYKHLINGFANITLLTKGRDEYYKVLDVYNKDIKSRFKDSVKAYETYNELKFQNVFLGVLNSEYMELYDKYSCIFTKDDGVITEFILEKFLFNNLQLNAGLNDDSNLAYTVERQKKFPFGTVDLYIEYDNISSIVELKVDTLKRKDVYQVYDYWESLSFEEKQRTEKVLIGNKVTDDVIELCKELDVNCYTYKFAQQDDDEYVLLVIYPEYRKGFVNFECIFEAYDNYLMIDGKHPNFNNTYYDYMKNTKEALIKYHNKHVNFEYELNELVEKYKNNSLHRLIK